MRNMLLRLWKDEQGSELIDYVLIVGLIVVASLLMVNSVGNNILTRWRGLLEYI